MPTYVRTDKIVCVNVSQATFGTTGRLMNYISKIRPRMFFPSVVLAAFMGVSAQTVLAEDSGKAIEDGAKATEKGFGNLLKGVGQEIGKVIEPTDKAKKDSGKKDAKQSDASKPPEENKP